MVMSVNLNAQRLAKQTDWDSMKPHWQAGILSISQLSRVFGVSRTAITKHWAKAGVTRSLKPQIQAEAESLVQKAEATGRQLATVAASMPRNIEHEVIGANARLQAEAILQHRATVGRTRALCARLLGELEAQFPEQAAPSAARQQPRFEAADRQEEALNSMCQAALTSARLDNLRRFAEVMRVCIDLERRVLGIADDTLADPGAGERAGQVVDSAFDQLRARFRARGLAT
jgi:hypothetical protein